MNMSMSLDGFIAAKNDSPEQPLGEDGDRLHEWLFRNNSEEYDKAIEGATQSLGAVIIGRRTYDNARASWGGHGPVEGVPSFILSKDIPDENGPMMTFVTDGIESALKKARAVAGDKSIDIMGANVQQQYLKAGLIDIIVIDLVPVILSEGVRLFDHLGDKHISLQQLEVNEGDQATHITYSVAK
jgi:dihydrofolate reductase